jgi:hypothetical protein
MAVLTECHAKVDVVEFALAVVLAFFTGTE